MITTPQNRIGGALLVIGTSLVVGTLVFTPGLALIDFVDADDFIGIGQAVRDNVALSIFTATFGVLGLVLQLFGLLALRKTAGGEDAKDTIVRFGVMAIGLGVVISIIDRTLFYTAAHTVAYGIGAGTGPDQTQVLDFLAVMFLKMQSAFNFVGFFAFLLGSIGLGVGLLPRLRSTPYRVVCALMVLSCLVSMVFVAAISPFYGLAGTFFLLFALSVNLANAFLIMLGVGLYKGVPELAGTDQPT
ncbi:MAG: hypothetical protein OXI56_01985 [bacterium]|nr:hypothetical protein [bacterium]MDE0600547.1 hypothetical protein [bacterium]